MSDFQITQIFAIIISGFLSFLQAIIVFQLKGLKEKQERIEEKFDIFLADCHSRHEHVMTKEEYWREHSPLETLVGLINSRIDKIEARVEVFQKI